MTTKIPGLPGLPKDASPELKSYLQALGEAVEVRLGRRGDPVDRGITLRELIDSGLAVSLKASPFDPNNSNAGNRGFTAPGTTPLDTAVPPAPTGLTTSAGFSSVLLTWNTGNTQFSTFAFTEVFRSTTNVIGDAVLLGISPGGTFTDQTVSAGTYYYWVRHVSTSDIRGPFNSTAGAVAVVAQEVSFLLQKLNSSISASQLTQSLANQIDGSGSAVDLANLESFVGYVSSYDPDTDGTLEARIGDVETQADGLETTYGTTTSAAASALAAAGSASSANAAETAAETAQAAAELAQTAAELAETNAATSESNTSTSETNAATSASNASTSETNAATSATNAATSASNASTSETNAASSETAAGNSATAASGSASNAATSATGAATSAAAAATSETNAATSESNASTSETNAATSETNAGTSESNAATSATNAATSETNAGTSATAAASSASNASTSATGAASSATAAASSETNAATSESNASTSETNAATSATNASGSETAAGTSETNAATSETNAGTSATNAASSATAAANSATDASSSATAAETSKTAAETAESNASTSATNAATSETNAGTSETNASSSATAAATSATNAASSESSAGTYASNAATSATDAAGSATSAASTVNGLTARLDNAGGTGVTVENAFTAQASDITGLEGQYTVKIDNNGAVAGFGLASTTTGNTTDTAFSEFIINADRFAFVKTEDSNGDVATVSTPFIIQATNTTLNGESVPAGVYIDQGFIKNGAITNAKIGDATIDNAKIANLDAGKVTTGELNANRISVDGSTMTRNSSGQLQVNELAANRITSGILDADDVNVVNLDAGNINAGTLTADRIDVTDLLLPSAGGVVTGSSLGGFPTNTDTRRFAMAVGVGLGFYQGFIRIIGGSNHVKSMKFFFTNSNSATPSSSNTIYESPLTRNLDGHIDRFYSTSDSANMPIMFSNSAHDGTVYLWVKASGDSGTDTLTSVEARFIRFSTGLSTFAYGAWSSETYVYPGTPSTYWSVGNSNALVWGGSNITPASQGGAVATDTLVRATDGYQYERLTFKTSVGFKTASSDLYSVRRRTWSST